MDIAARAREYVSRGWAIVPIPYKKKSPIVDDWQSLSIDDNNLKKYFNGAKANIGVQLGPKSGGLADIDLDCEEARVLALHFLPKTNAIFGRHSNPSSHWLYKLIDDTDKAAFKFLDPDTAGSEILALRSGGGNNSAQTVFPGSTHETGEAIEWTENDSPAEIGFEPLIKACGRLAIAALALRQWPSRGRHETTLRLSGVLVRAGWEEDEIISFIETVATEAGDDEVDNRLKTARYVCAAFSKNENVYGLPALKEVFGDKHAEFIAKWSGYSEDTNQQILQDLNDKYCVVPVGGKMRVLKFDIREGRRFPIFYSFEDFRNMLDNQKVFSGSGKSTKATGMGSWWLANPKRRQVEGLLFRPGLEPMVDGCINLWQGFAIEPVQGDWTLIRSHITNVLAKNDCAADEYIYKWCCWTIQHPGEAPGVALVFQGGKGTGKGFFGTALTDIFGQHGLHISSHEQLAGRFNKHLMDCALLFADEAYWPGDKGNSGNLKRLITEPTLAIEAKGLDIISVENSLHVIMATNASWVVPASLDERRFAIFKVSENYKQKAAYFVPLYKQRKNGGLAAMLFDMLAFDLQGWHPRNEPPQNEALSDQKLQSLSYEDQWWYELLQEGSIPNSWEDIETGEYSRVTVGDILEHVQLSSPRLKQISMHLLGRYLRSVKCFPKSDGAKRFWQFPGLQQARADWNKLLHTKWDDKLTKWIRYDQVF